MGTAMALDAHNISSQATPPTEREQQRIAYAAPPRRRVRQHRGQPAHQEANREGKSGGLIESAVFYYYMFGGESSPSGSIAATSKGTLATASSTAVTTSAAKATAVAVTKPTA